MDWLSLTLIVALLSLWITYFNYWRSNYVVVRIHDCRSSGEMNIQQNGGNFYYYFTIVIQNLGIPLQNLRMVLNYRPLNDTGRLTLPLYTKSGSHLLQGTFAKGMFAEFTFQSHRLEPADMAFLCQLKDAEAQDGYFVLFADDYKVWSLKLRRNTNFLKRLWNRIAGKINVWSIREVGKNREGIPTVKQYLRLPQFIRPECQITDFATSLRREAERGTSTALPLRMRSGNNSVPSHTPASLKNSAS